MKTANYKKLISLLILLNLNIICFTAEATPLKIKFFDQKQYSGKLTLKVDGKEAAKFELKGADSWVEIDDINYLPAQKISLNGEFKEDQSWFRGAKKGVQEFTAVDIGIFFRYLREDKKPFTDRLSKFIQEKLKFEENNRGILEGAVFNIEFETKSTNNEIEQAEKKLGFSLPEEFVSMVLKNGAPKIEDSFYTPANLINNSFEQMEDVWGTPREELNKFSKDLRDFLKSTVILYTESGDGYGGIIYKPSKSEGAYGKTGYYYIHQDNIYEPFLIIENNGKGAFTELLMWQMLKTAFEIYDIGDNSFVFIDSSSRKPLNYILEPDIYNKNFAFRLRIDIDKL